MPKKKKRKTKRKPVFSKASGLGMQESSQSENLFGRLGRWLQRMFRNPDLTSPATSNLPEARPDQAENEIFEKALKILAKKISGITPEQDYHQMEEAVSGYLKLIENLGPNQEIIKAIESPLGRLNKILKDHPHHTAARAWKGLVLLTANKPDEAFPLLQQAVKKYPDEPNIHVGLSLVCWIKERFEQTLQHAEKAIQLYSDTEEHARLGVALLMKARALQKFENKDQATEFFQKAAKLNPNASLIHLVLGQHLMDVERYEEALEALDQAYVLNTEDSSVHEHRANCYLKLECFDDALSCAQEGLNKKPDSMSLIRIKASAFNKLGRFDAAISSLALVLRKEISGINLLLIHHEAYKAYHALGRIDDALARTQPKYVDAVIGSMACLDEGDLNIATLDAAIRKRSELAYLWHDLKGEAFRRRGQFEDAQTEFRRSLELNRDNAKALATLARNFRGLGNSEDSLEAIEKSLALEPKNVEALIIKADIYHEIDRDVDSLKVLRLGLEIDQDNAELHASIGRSLWKLDRDDEALQYLDHAIKVSPDYEFAWRLRGLALESLSKFEEAVSSFTRALEINPESLSVLRNLGDVLISLERSEEALEHLNKAIKIDPSGSAILGTKGRALIALDRNDEATEVLQKGAHLDPNQIWIHMNLAQALINLDRNQDALNVLNEAIKNNPEAGELLTQKSQILAEMGLFEKSL
ncbi:tetratricopeptide repeat protein [Candidatus Nitrospira allomarina]|uniref:Tetratricopeptide repeat protein n=1 Tax=Candidatus Nitrospira allomarina TaxID=3020900 RepID=A0AA96JY17_9BACT|nr:tetratricopeptide repeat protein [Candidatus Nitrospira allomarina]WNM59731.1 tetratricopeptide repeat protein [Candidatus Nitrospira allomarina]